MIEDGELHFCCKGCQGIYHLLRSEGLDSFYDKLGGTKLQPPKEIVDQSSRLDLESFKKKYMRTTPEGFSQISLIIEGIHCVACVWLNEKILSKTDGIIEAAINFTNNKALIVFDENKIKLSSIIDKIRSIGYNAYPYDARLQEESANRARKSYYFKMIVGVFGTMNIMWIAIALWAGYFGEIAQDHKNILHLAEFILATPVLSYSGSVFFKGAYYAVKNRMATMDTLVATGATLTYLYSIWAALTGAGEVYFDSVTMIITFVLAGKFLETLSKKEAVDTLDRLSSMLPTETIVIRDGEKCGVELEEVAVGETIELCAGDFIALDGVLSSENATVDESNLTGEAMPVEKKEGDKLLSGTINTGGAVRYTVTQDFEHSNFKQILRLLEESLQHKPKLQTLANSLSRYFSATILLLAAATFGGWYMIGHGFETALVTAVSVIVIACPCALALATPIATLVGLGVAAKNGIVVKAGGALELLAKADVALLDKTGTLTVGRPQVVNVTRYEEFDERLVLSLCQASKHPVAKGVAEHLRQIAPLEIRVQEIAAMGLVGEIDGHRIIGGSPTLLEKEGVQVEFRSEATLFCVAQNGRLSAVYELQDTLKPNAAQTIEALKAAGLRVVMLTGDRDEAATNIARQAGINEVRSRLTPSDKLSFVERLQKEGHVVLMVGDGINDAPALAVADVAIAMGGGADVSMHASDIALLHGSLDSLAAAVRIAKKTFATIRQNIALSIGYNALTIPLAMSGFIIPLFAALSMSASSLLVCANSMRIKKEANHG